MLLSLFLFLCVCVSVMFESLVNGSIRICRKKLPFFRFRLLRYKSNGFSKAFRSLFFFAVVIIIIVVLHFCQCDFFSFCCCCCCCCFSLLLLRRKPMYCRYYRSQLSFPFFSPSFFDTVFFLSCH